MNSTTDHYMLKLTSLNQVTDLALGKPNMRGELLWRFQPILQLARL